MPAGRGSAASPPHRLPWPRAHSGAGGIAVATSHAAAAALVRLSRGGAIGAMCGALAAGAPEGEPLLPDLDQETPTELIIDASADRSWRLGFRSAVRNVGAGPLIIDGAPAVAGQTTMDAEQMIVRSRRARRRWSAASGSLRYVRSPDHQHWHLLGFDRYELRRPGDRRRGRATARAASASATATRSPTRARRRRRPRRCTRAAAGSSGRRCSAIREGISVGYGDDYSANLEGQYLPLDGLRRGRYVLVHAVNADRRLLETSYANNASSALLRLRCRRGVPRIDDPRGLPAPARGAPPAR